MTPKQIAAWLARIALLGLVVVVMVFGKLYGTAAGHYQRAEELFDQGDLRQAMIDYEAVITNYTPLFNGRVEKAAQRLLEIGRKFEEADSLTLAFRAYQSLTSGLSGIRSIIEPYPELNRQGRQELERVAEVIDREERARWQAYEADSTSSGKK